MQTPRPIVGANRASYSFSCFYENIEVRDVPLIGTLKRVKKKRSGHTQQHLVETILEAKRTAEAVALGGKHLYDSGEINGDDLHKILLAIESIFSYLNNRYTNISSLSEEVYKMAKTLYDPAVEQKGIEKGIEKGKLEGRKEVAVKLLTKRFGKELTEELKEKILKTNEKTIDYIMDNLLEITLDELKEILK